MSLWIKICGNTTLADALLAAEAGADAVGFVFAPSPRRVTIEQVAAITPNLPPKTEKIGVFVHGDYGAIASTVAHCGLSGVQLHSAGDGDLPSRLRRRFGPDLRILRVVHFGEETAAQLAEAGSDPHIDAVLVDSRTATAAGGTGISYDWQAARAAVDSAQSQLNLVVAGGLTPANVHQAIAALKPWGVDVASGVEAAPGAKDADKVRAFIAYARGAAGAGS